MSFGRAMMTSPYLWELSLMEIYCFLILTYLFYEQPSICVKYHFPIKPLTKLNIKLPKISYE